MTLIWTLDWMNHLSIALKSVSTMDPSALNNLMYQIPASGKNLSDVPFSGMIQVGFRAILN